MSWKIKIKEDLKGGLLSHFLWKFTLVLARGGIQLGTSLHPVELPQPRKSEDRSWEERKCLKQGLGRFQLSKSKMAKQISSFHGLCRKLYWLGTLPSCAPSSWATPDTRWRPETVHTSVPQLLWRYHPALTIVSHAKSAQTRVSHTTELPASGPEVLPKG